MEIESIRKMPARAADIRGTGVPSRIRTNKTRNGHIRVERIRERIKLQGYLAHKKTPDPLGPP